VLLALVAVLVVGWLGWSRSTGSPDTLGATILRERTHSELLDRDLEQVIALPEGFSKADRRGLLVLLHGRGDSPAGRANAALLAALGAGGPRAPVVLVANGGEASYYHDRADGPWGSYLSEELIPATVARFGLNSSRIAFAGISMGGFGALEQVRLSGERQCGVAAMAPALWDDAAKTPAGAFDDADDFAAHDVLGAVGDDPSALHGTPVFLVVGQDDPFRATTAALAAALEPGPSRVEHVVAAGGHDGAFWDAHTGAVVAWLSKQLARC
jgi:S-formylglutathione hydrolase FrmB